MTASMSALRPISLVIVLSAFAVTVSQGASTLVPMTTFGGGDGWRAPNEILSGDTAGTATGSNYNYLGTGSLERGLAYNPATGNLVLVSRSTAGNGIRVLNGTTGADSGALNQGSGIISGGTFTTNMVAASSDGSIYVANLITSAASAFKVYRWNNETSAAPTVWHNAVIASGPVRLGDDLDLTGSGAGTTLAAGAGSTSLGYAIVTSTGASYVNTWGPGIAGGDFRLGITFAATSADVLGKETSDTLKVTSYSATNGSLANAVALTSNGEMALDHAMIDGKPYLATLDANASTVRVYDFSSPTAPLLLNSLTTTSGTLTANGNATGQVRWGNISGSTATLYAMATNQGIQAFVFQVPEPGIAALFGMASLALLRRRR